MKVRNSQLHVNVSKMKSTAFWNSPHAPHLTHTLELCINEDILNIPHPLTEEMVPQNKPKNNLKTGV